MLIGVDASRVTRARRTGTENYSLQVLREVLRQDARNHYRLYLASPMAPGLLPHGERVSTRLIRLPRLWTQVGLSREMLLAPPDLLFVPSHVLPLVHPRRSVVVVYDVGHRFFPRAHGALEWLSVEWAIRRHVREATALITISEASRRDLVRLYRADPARVAVAFPAADAAFRPQPADAVAAVRGRHGLPEPYVLHVGTLKPRKNLPRLVAAFAAALPDLPAGTGLVLAGNADRDAAAVRRAIDAFGVGDRVRLLPYVDAEDLPALYAGAACVAVVSLYEGFGMPALEALGCGAPLLASRHGSLPEVVGEAGLCVDPLDVGAIAQGLRRLVGDADLAQHLRTLGPRRAEQLSWAEAGRVTLEVLERGARSVRPLLPGTPAP